jgi:hypothetical protein
MTERDADLDLSQGLARSGLSYHELWLRHVAVGGVADEIEIEAYVLGLLKPDPYTHDVVATALNEYFLDKGQDYPVSYWNK